MSDPANLHQSSKQKGRRDRVSGETRPLGETIFVVPVGRSPARCWPLLIVGALMVAAPVWQAGAAKAMSAARSLSRGERTGRFRAIGAEVGKWRRHRLIKKLFKREHQEWNAKTKLHNKVQSVRREKEARHEVPGLKRAEKRWKWATAASWVLTPAAMYAAGHWAARNVDPSSVWLTPDHWSNWAVSIGISYALVMPLLHSVVSALKRRGAEFRAGVDTVKAVAETPGLPLTSSPGRLLRSLAGEL